MICRLQVQLWKLRRHPSYTTSRLGTFPIPKLADYLFNCGYPFAFPRQLWRLEDRESYGPSMLGQDYSIWSATVGFTSAYRIHMRCAVEHIHACGP